MFAWFADFQKAFDAVIHTGIKIKLLENGIGHHFYNIIKSMYSQSKSCVRLNNTLTDVFGSYVGVKQGDNLNSNLFKIFIDDLPDYLMYTTDPIFIDKQSAHCLLYADDVNFLSSTSQELQNRSN